MYSMVLMMAMSTTPDITTNHNGYAGCSGSSCTGSSCTGCEGGSCHGGFLGMKKHGSGIFGGCTGCNGSSCTGCDGGSCHGGFLGMKKHGSGMFGGGGLFGKHKSNGCSGSSCTGCCGGMGAPVPEMMHSAPVVEHPPVVEHHAPAPCETVPLAPIHGSPIITTTPPVHGTPTPSTTVPKMMPELKKEEPKKMPELKHEEPKKSTMAPAKIELNVPQGAKVSINGLEVGGDAAVRHFQTRNLEPNVKEVYTVTAEVVVNGKKQTATETLTVKAGETTSVTLTPKSDLVSK